MYSGAAHQGYMRAFQKILLLGITLLPLAYLIFVASLLVSGWLERGLSDRFNVAIVVLHLGFAVLSLGLIGWYVRE